MSERDLMKVKYCLFRWDIYDYRLSENCSDTFLDGFLKNSSFKIAMSRRVEGCKAGVGRHLGFTFWLTFLPILNIVRSFSCLYYVLSFLVPNVFCDFHCITETILISSIVEKQKTTKHSD